MNIFIQLVICIFLSSLLLTAFTIDTWQYWVGIVLIIGQFIGYQVCFGYAGNFMDYDTYVRKLSDVCPKYNVIWKGEE